MKIAVLVSGNGSNLQAIIDSIAKGYIKATIELVISNKKDAYALKRAEKASIKTFILDPEGFKTREDYDKEVIEKLKENNIDLVVLAGFMRLLSPYFVKEYKDKILNIHPSLLPLFKGTHAIKDAFESKAKKTGVTVHFVDEKLDNGPIIMQEELKIEDGETLEALEEKIHKIEHRLYPKVIKLFTEGKIIKKDKETEIVN